MNKAVIDFEKTVGKIKPMHGINNAPILPVMGPVTSLFHYLKEAGIPYSRTHDTGGAYGASCFVDIENIFRDFEADPYDPASYDFSFTDCLFAELNKADVEPFYRLGTTIENGHRIKAYRIFPPKDNLKWAKICEGIINHYNHGWADGFHYNIKYWEIWNEPDNEPEPADSPMWKGTKEQYFALYETASNYLKEKFPYIKIGGYASCGFYALYEESVIEEANVSKRTGYFIEFFHEFLKYISENKHKSPFDFFSWHSYDGVKNNIKSAEYVRKALDEYGFTKTESILNEWNPGNYRRGTEEDASYISEMMCAMHRAPLDVLIYYDGQIEGAYQGLFDPFKMDIFPAYYAFFSFNELYELKNEVYSSCESLPLLAASDGKKGKILIPNTGDTDEEISLELKGGFSAYAYRVLDGTNGLVKKDFKDEKTFIIPAKKIVIIECEKN